MNKTTIIKFLAVLILLVFANKNVVTAQTCTATFTWINNGGGNYSFSSTAVPVTSNTAFLWNFPGATPSVTTGTVVNVTFTAAGVHTVTLFNLSPPTCSASLSQTLLVPNTCSLNSNFTFTNGSNGQVFFTNLSTGTNSSTTYYWNFGNGQSSTLINPSITYTSNGVYLVTLHANNTFPACNDSISFFVNVNNVITCTVAFNYTPSSSGQVTFQSLANPATPTTSYAWQFGNGQTFSVTGTQTAIATYSAAGIYTVTLFFSNPPSCFGSVSHTISVPAIVNPCALNTNFQSFTTGPGQITFQNLTTGTTSATSYTWDFGDNNSSNAVSPVHNYPANGTFTVTLFASHVLGLFECSDTISEVVTVNTFPCPQANISHTALGNGVVTFSSSANASVPNAIYYWDFGDGSSGTGGIITHTYNNGGTHYIKHIVGLQSVNCSDTTLQAINITGVSCLARAGFSLWQVSSGQYQLIPDYPWNTSGSQWSWGDGASSAGFNSSHSYNAGGNYQICLTVTATCGDTATVCKTFSLSGSGNNILVQVQMPNTVGIGNLVEEEAGFSLYPNPAQGQITLETGSLAFPVSLFICDISGKTIWQKELKPDDEKTLKIDLTNFSPGLYSLMLRSNNKVFVMKFVESR